MKLFTCLSFLVALLSFTVAASQEADNSISDKLESMDRLSVEQYAKDTSCDEWKGQNA